MENLANFNFEISFKVFKADRSLSMKKKLFAFRRTKCQRLKEKKLTWDKIRGIDEKVENAKAEKVSEHFRGGCFKAELIYGH